MFAAVGSAPKFLAVIIALKLISVVQGKTLMTYTLGNARPWWSLRISVQVCFDRGCFDSRSTIRQNPLQCRVLFFKTMFNMHIRQQLRVVYISERVRPVGICIRIHVPRNRV